MTTGIPASDCYVARGDDHLFITLKTHYPAKSDNVRGAEEMDRAILHLRNPLNAFPSYASFKFE
eukprot:6594303-Ditylum_brightwellii.AAC.1